jgi:hypothetical protein
MSRGFFGQDARGRSRAEKLFHQRFEQQQRLKVEKQRLSRYLASIEKQDTTQDDTKAIEVARDAGLDSGS